MYTVKRSKKRFNFLLLDNEEYYFQRYRSILYTREDLPSDDAADGDDRSHVGIAGWLHVASLNLYFEPHDEKNPVLKMNLGKLERHPSRWSPANWVKKRLNKMRDATQTVTPRPVEPAASSSWAAGLMRAMPFWQKKEPPKDFSRGEGEYLEVRPATTVKICENGKHHAYNFENSSRLYFLAIQSTSGTRHRWIKLCRHLTVASGWRDTIDGVCELGDF